MSQEQNNVRSVFQIESPIWRLEKYRKHDEKFPISILFLVLIKRIRVYLTKYCTKDDSVLLILELVKSNRCDIK
jgi:hypothetical protein